MATDGPASLTRSEGALRGRSARRGGLILVINPGSTSTKLAVFELPANSGGGRQAGRRRRPSRPELRCLDERTIEHSAEELKGFRRVADQEDFRAGLVDAYLAAVGVKAEGLSAVAGRGGLLRALPGGTYRVNAAMLRDLREARHGEHASNLGAVLAARIAEGAGCPAFIVDPVVVDELAPEARLTGLPQIARRSIFHALSQRAAARAACERLGVRYERAHLVVAHLGGGISVGAHRQGRVVEVNNALDGDGPFSPERAGTLPAGDLVRLVLAGEHRPEELRKMLTGRGGLVAHLGTNSLLEVLDRAAKGDGRAQLVFDALAYGVARAIAGAAAALGRAPQAVVLAGAMARSRKLVAVVRRRAGFLGPVMVFAGNLEMGALAAGAARVLSGRERAGNY